MVTATSDSSSAEPSPARRDRSPWNWLLAPAAIAPLLTFIFNRDEPRLAGIPFFYWFQLLLVAFAAACTSAVYLATRRGGASDEA
ncbi:DUF3311 domain-containing protein [Kitasatospora cineracea]|uniref:Uncharacterized protein DUF3311 n=1 Tax=Kitasatospora cineracea TaxID=88074 RepID=A0A3N4RJE8_9ACTN|nr:DUF3311 domain-containing protein [Kitasatospora cineracea]RPE28517.1 uncharacterized protein DUF3311 [Kitasatospora cineracea]